MKNRLAVAAAVVATSMSIAAIPSRAFARSCSGGYTHAVIEGSEKCLRAGEFCVAGDNREYSRYGYTCVLYRSGYHHLRRR